MNIRYRVELHQSERDELTAFLAGGKQRVRRLKRAQILLATDRGASDAEIAERVVCGISTVTRTKRRFVEGGPEPALSEARRSGARRKLTGREEALLACGVEFNVGLRTVAIPPGFSTRRFRRVSLARARLSVAPHDFDRSC